MTAAPLGPRDSSLPAAYRRLSACSPLRGSRSARVPSCLRFVRQRGDVLSVFPASHALVVMAPAGASAHAVWIADEERTDALRLAEGDHSPRALVAQVPDLAAFAGTHAASSGQELARPSRARLTALAFPGQVSERSVVPPFEGPDAAPRHHQRCSCVGGDSCLMDLS